jgi:hypothetical protein
LSHQITLLFFFVQAKESAVFRNGKMGVPKHTPCIGLAPNHPGSTPRENLICQSFGPKLVKNIRVVIISDTYGTNIALSGSAALANNTYQKSTCEIKPF